MKIIIWSKTNLQDGYKSFVPPETITEWNKEALHIWNSSGFNILKKKLLTFMGSLANTNFKCHNPKGIKFLITFRLEVIFAYIDSNIAFKTPLFRISCVQTILRQLFTISFTKTNLPDSQIAKNSNSEIFQMLL